MGISKKEYARHELQAELEEEIQEKLENLVGHFIAGLDFDWPGGWVISSISTTGAHAWTNGNNWRYGDNPRKPAGEKIVIQPQFETVAAVRLGNKGL